MDLPTSRNILSDEGHSVPRSMLVMSGYMRERLPCVPGLPRLLNRYGDTPYDLHPPSRDRRISLVHSKGPKGS